MNTSKVIKMGGVVDLFRGGKYDYVDTHYWSVMQIKVKQFAFKNPNLIMDHDLGKVGQFGLAIVAFTYSAIKGAALCKYDVGQGAKRRDDEIVAWAAAHTRQVCTRINREDKVRRYNRRFSR